MRLRGKYSRIVELQELRLNHFSHELPESFIWLKSLFSRRPLSITESEQNNKVSHNIFSKKFLNFVENIMLGDCHSLVCTLDYEKHSMNGITNKVSKEIADLFSNLSIMLYSSSVPKARSVANFNRRNSILSSYTIHFHFRCLRRTLAASSQLFFN